MSITNQKAASLWNSKKRNINIEAFTAEFGKDFVESVSPAAWERKYSELNTNEKLEFKRLVTQHFSEFCKPNQGVS